VADDYCQPDTDPVTTDRCMCGDAYQMVEGFEPGERRFFLSKGQFSLVDIAIALVQHVGPCELQCAVWTGTEDSIDRVQTLVSDGDVHDVRWILCDSQRSMNEERLNRIVQLFGVDSVRVTPLHAKLLTVHNDDWSLVVQTSANMTLNRSVEQFDVTDSPKLYGFVDDFFAYVFDDVPPLDEEPPFDGWDYEQVEQRYQDMCLGDHKDHFSVQSLIKEVNASEPDFDL